MRIAYLGNFRPDHSTETHIARTLEQLGHTVIRLQEDGYLPAGLTRALDAAEPDLMLFTRTWGATLEMQHLERLRAQGVPTVSYHLDLYVPLERNGGLDGDPFWRTDWVFTPDGDPRSAAEFERRGINHRWLLPAVVADECYLAADVPLTRDVIFVGSGPGYHPEHTYRGDLLTWLTQTYGPRFRQYGGRGQSVRGYALNRLYASTRVAVGDSLNLVRDGTRWASYASDRRYEGPGRGALQIFPKIEGLDDGFTDGQTIVEYDYGDWTGLKDRIDHYLTYDDERERIRRAGHEHVRAGHTYTHRLTQMLGLLRSEGAVPACYSVDDPDRNVTALPLPRPAGAGIEAP